MQNLNDFKGINSSELRGFFTGLILGDASIDKGVHKRALMIKSINRDFSDAVLMAEVLKYLYPKLVNLHNYPEVHSTKQKIYNWQTLNEKVFKKIEIPLSKKTIDSLANAEQGVIEKVLKKLYLKVKNDECSLQKIDLMNSQKLKKENKEIDYKNVIYNKELEIIQLKKKLILKKMQAVNFLFFVHSN